MLGLAGAGTLLTNSEQERKNMAVRHIIASKDRLMNDLKAVVADSEELLKEVAGELSDRGQKARARLQKTLESAKGTCADLQDKAKAGVEATDTLVHEQPYASMGIAFGVGLLIGVLVAQIE